MNIFEVFRAAANPAKAGPMRAYMRNQFPFLGLAAPERRALSHNFLKDARKVEPDWAFVSQGWAQPEREFQYLAVAYLGQVQARLTLEDLPRLRELVTQKSWWDTVDELAGIIGYILLRYPAGNELISRWSRDENIWLRRVAIIHQLRRKEKTDPELLGRIIESNFGQTEFFINKAIGWSLREYGKTNPDWVRGFLTRHQKNISSLSLREATRYL
ncbi:MAG: DNA alkylation repair protein [Deltaproteobacteria bacterium]|nr:DNA alkylation repair protein [Deltaproteobacteria bacterium]